MNEDALSTNGYLIDVNGLPAARADQWRSRAWLLASVRWGTRDRLVETATAVAAEMPEASAWITFKQGEEDVLLSMAKGSATVGPVGDITKQIAATYRLDAAEAAAAQGALLAYEQPGMELEPGRVVPPQRFDSALLRTGSIVGVDVGAFRIEGRVYLLPEDLAKLQARAVAEDRSVSATLEEAYLRVRATYLDGVIPGGGRASGTFMSLAPWFAYELRTTGSELDRSQSWLIHRIVARAFP